MTEQKPAEFLPPPDAAATALALGQPTGACLLVCAQLEALQRALATSLEGPNMAAFQLEVGGRCTGCLFWPLESSMPWAD